MITPTDLTSYSEGFNEAGIALQAAARTLSSALERLAALDESNSTITTVGWTYADLQNGVAKDPVGTLRRILETLRTIGSTRDTLTRELLGDELAPVMTRLSRAFHLAALISAEALASAN